MRGGRAAVVGAGIVGLSVAWFLQEEGFEVTVLDSRGVAAGASAGNAGWITPGLVSPLAEPGVLAYALRSIVRRDSPLRLAPSALPANARFLSSFALNCTQVKWSRGVQSLAGIGALALRSYDRLERGGVTAPVRPAPILMAFTGAAEAAPVTHELRATAGDYRVSELSQRELRAECPLLSDRARHGLRLEGQRYVQPLEYTQSLAESFSSRGGQLSLGARVDRVEPVGGGRLSVTAAGAATSFDTVVLASGAWLSRLGRSAGVRAPLAAGRGYSFTVKTETTLSGPLYLPSLRVACTPVPEGMRVAGTMEFRSADAPLDRRRIDAIVRSATGLFKVAEGAGGAGGRPPAGHGEGVDWSSSSDLWVGPRPVTADGLPLIGATKHEGLYVAGGHGMWGMTLGPATGQLLAEYIATGELPDALRPVDPCR
jgi:D-amino-acid dehydrogenase